MDLFSNPRFANEILGIARSYGDLGFWTENLDLGVNPDATWRALLTIGCLKDGRFSHQVRAHLESEDSRVRAWACFALGQAQDEASLETIYQMNADTSNRVRIHAWQAVQAMVGLEQSARHFPVRIPQYETLVLISEDSVRIQEDLATLFRTSGFRIEIASSQQETMQKALALKPQAIVTDNQKGKDNLSGLNMTFDLSRESQLRETVIFMLTADFVEPIFLWNGGDCFLSKFHNNLRDLAILANEYLHH